ncbi:carboxynorspermidine decarboxylase [Thermodesulfobacteriota bacterium]
MWIETTTLPTPSYVCHRGLLERNLLILDSIQQRTGCRILLAFKGFAMFSLFPQISRFLCGVSASSLDEARLGREEFGGEVHVYMPAYKAEEFAEVLHTADHLIFNSFSQWKTFRQELLTQNKKVTCGIRVNPQSSSVAVDLYNPCGRYSRLGVTRAQFEPDQLTGIEGLHFHALCEQNVDALAVTLEAFEEKFGSFIPSMKWVNFGGGHHITREDYNRDLLCDLITAFQDRYNVQVYLEPGEAVALNTGVLVTRVLDIVRNEIDIAILDTSAAAHMPDVLEMPYRPNVVGAGKAGEYPFTYRLGGLTCLAGDVIGDYSFPQPLEVGRKLVFEDMAHYTMVKNNTFNGVRLPHIGIYDPETERTEIIRSFSYQDYRNRLS